MQANVSPPPAHHLMHLFICPTKGFFTPNSFLLSFSLRKKMRRWEASDGWKGVCEGRRSFHLKPTCFVLPFLYPVSFPSVGRFLILLKSLAHDYTFTHWSLPPRDVALVYFWNRRYYFILPVRFSTLMETSMDMLSLLVFRDQSEGRGLCWVQDYRGSIIWRIKESNVSCLTSVHNLTTCLFFTETQTNANSDSGSNSSESHA